MSKPNHVSRIVPHFRILLLLLVLLLGTTGPASALLSQAGEALRPGTMAPVAWACAGRVYIVQSGDNLFRLALRFGTTVEAIMAANGLSSSLIRVGQSLLIPVCVVPCEPACPPVCVPVCPSVCVPVCQPACVPVCPPVCPPVCLDIRSQPCVPLCVTSPRLYVVQRGDTLYRLAAHFDVSVALLMKANCLQTTKLKAGQRLIVP